MQNNNPTFVGIDVGTTTVRVVVGQHHDESEAPTIVGVGEAESLGMRKGSVANPSEVANAISTAIAQAEQTSGAQINSATVSVNGPHIAGMTSKGVIAVSSSDKEITTEEIERVEDAATIVQLPENREILHVFSRSFRLDGQENVKNPMGMKGVRLEVDSHVTTASTPAMRNMYSVFDQANVSVSDRLVVGVADSNSVLSRTQRESGVVLVDIGSSTTNVVIHEDGDVQHVAVIPVGGVSITNDLAIGLRTEIDIAESIKLKLGSEHDDVESKDVEIKVGSKTHSFSREDISEIVFARVEELLELIDHELSSVGRSGKLPGGVVFVGGGANLHGLVDYTKDKLSLPARIVVPKGFSGITDKIGKPGYACAVGLMLHDMQVGGGGKTANQRFDAVNKFKKRGKKSSPGASSKAKNILNKFKP